MKLREYCTYRNDRINSDELNTHNYISTENLLPNKGGITEATSIPTGNVVRYDKGNILISNIRPYFKKIWLADKSGGCSADVLCIKSNDKVTSKFLYYLLSQQSFFDYVMAGAKGCKMPRGDKSHIMEWDVNIPDIDEQKRIADFLSSLDDKIELNRQINDNLEQQAQALFKSWFVDNKKDSWAVGRVSDFYDVTIGKTPPRKETQWFSSNCNDVTWVSISDLGSCGMFINQSSEYLTPEAIKQFNVSIVPKGTVLLSFKLTIGRIAISDINLTTNEAIAHFRTDKDYLLEYTYLALKDYQFSTLGSTSSIATAINSKIIKSMEWIMPFDEDLKGFHALVNPIFEQIKTNITEINNLTQLRDTLLPRLMSGELKINEINC